MPEKLQVVAISAIAALVILTFGILYVANGNLNTVNLPNSAAFPKGTTFNLTTPFPIDHAWTASANLTGHSCPNSGTSGRGGSLFGLVEGSAPFSIRIVGNGGYWNSVTLPALVPQDIGHVTGTGSYYHPIQNGNYTVTFVSQTQGATVLVDATIGVGC